MWREYFQVTFNFSRICCIFANAKFLPATSYITIYMTVAFIQGNSMKFHFTAICQGSLKQAIEPKKLTTTAKLYERRCTMLLDIKYHNLM